MLPGKRDGAGRLYVSSAVVPAGSPFKGGMALSHVGQQYVSNTDTPAPVKTLGLDFLDGKLDPRITFARNSVGTYFNKDGVLQTAAANIPRFTYDPVIKQPLGLLIEEQRINSYRNNTMQGAALGVVGSGGALPTNWASYNPLGLTREVVYVGTQNGINVIDIRVSGTVGGVGSFDIGFDGSAYIAASSGQTWSLSLWNSLSAGSFSNISTTNIRVAGRDGPSELESTILSISPGTTLVRNEVTRTLNNAGTLYVYPYLHFQTAGAGAVDFTIRIGMPQCEQGTSATSVIPTTTSAVTRAADDATMTGTNFSSWYRQDEGTFIVKGPTWVKYTGSNKFPKIASIIPATGGDFIGLSYGVIAVATDARPNIQNQTNFGDSLDANGQVISLAYKTNDTTGSHGSVVYPTDTTCVIPLDMLRLEIGRTGNGDYLNGPVAFIDYYSSRIPNAKLAAFAAGQQYINSFKVDDTGVLNTAPGGVIANYQGGLPFTKDGELVVQLNQTPAAGDPYVGGIRVGAAGVHVTDVAP
jgi:hypothetical protein